VVLPVKSLIIVPFHCMSMVLAVSTEGGRWRSFRTRHWLGGGTIPPDTSLTFGAVFGDSAPISFGERVPESRGVKIPTVSRRSGLLPPGGVQITTVDGVEAKIVDKAKHRCLGVQRITDYRESYPPRRPPRNALLEKTLGEHVVERLDHGMPDLLRDPLAVKHAPVDRIDAAIAKLRVVVAGIDAPGESIQERRWISDRGYGSL